METICTHHMKPAEHWILRTIGSDSVMQFLSWETLRQFCADHAVNPVMVGN